MAPFKGVVHPTFTDPHVLDPSDIHYVSVPQRKDSHTGLEWRVGE